MISKITLYKQSLKSDDHMVVATPISYDPKSQRILISVNNKVAEATYNPKTGNVTAKIVAPQTNANHPLASQLPQNTAMRVKVFVYDFIQDKILDAKLQESEFNFQELNYKATDDLLTTSPVIMGDWDKIGLVEKATNLFSNFYWSKDALGTNKITGYATQEFQANLEETVYFHISVNKIIPVGTTINFILVDYDTALFLDIANPDDVEFGGKKIVKNAIVIKGDKENKIVLKLYLDQSWIKELEEDQGPLRDADLDLYWAWKYKNKPYNSKEHQLSVYPSKTTLRLMPAIEKEGYNLPEIYSHTGDIILYAIELSPEGKIKKFVSIKIRNTKTYKFKKDLDKFIKEIYTENINLETNRLENANYSVEEVNHYFKFKENATKIFIEEELLEQPILKGSKLARYNSIAKVWKFVKKAPGLFDNLDILQQMREMIPELSSNNEFNMPSLSTFVGFIPRLNVYTLVFSLAEYLLLEQIEEQNKVINDSFWLKWQNTKRQGLDKVLAFIETPWAKKNEFKKTFVIHDVLQKLFKGEFKTLDKLRDKSFENDEEKNYLVVTYRVTNEKLDTFMDIVDCIIIIK